MKSRKLINFERHPQNSSEVSPSTQKKLIYSVNASIIIIIIVRLASRQWITLHKYKIGRGQISGAGTDFEMTTVKERETQLTDSPKQMTETSTWNFSSNFYKGLKDISMCFIRLRQGEMRSNSYK